MAGNYAVDCVLCSQILYENEDHIGRAFKIIYDAKNKIYTNYCKTCLKKHKEEKIIDNEKHAMYIFNCNQIHCRFGCKVISSEELPFWDLNKNAI